MLGAFGSEGMIVQSNKIGAMKRVDVERFLEFDLLPRLPSGSVLVLDNAKIHHGGRIKEIVEATGCSLLYLYLSPYSPDFSPIELAWSWIKQFVRRLSPRDEQARQNAVESAINALPKGFTRDWFQKCGYCLQ